MDNEDAPIKHCPICFSYVQGHPTNSLFRKCPTCGFSYKIGDERKARQRARDKVKKDSQN